MEEKRIYQRHRSIFGPMLLIAIGVAFLLNNMGVVPGNFWSVLFNLWPLLLVFAGIDSLVRREGVAWPTLLIGVGVFLLLQNYNLVVWYGWGKIWRLWPVLLVAFGIDLIFKDRPLWSTIFGVIMVVLLVVGGLWLAGFSNEIGGSLPIDAQQILEEGITQAKLSFGLGAGEMQLSESTEKDILVTGSISHQTGRESYKEENDKAIYTINSDSPQFYPSQHRWELRLSTQIPLEINADMGAGDMDLYMEKIQLERLVVEQGVGQIELRLPGQDTYYVEVSQAIGEIRILIPEGTALRVETSKALSSMDLPQDFSLQGGYYLSPSYQESNESITIMISQAIGKIEIEYAK